MSSDFVVKIADFGLSKDVYHKDYYRRDEKSSTPLPIKWMALESLRNNGEFSSKSDVVRLYIVYPSYKAVSMICPLVDNLDTLIWKENVKAKPDFYLSRLILSAPQRRVETVLWPTDN